MKLTTHKRIMFRISLVFVLYSLIGITQASADKDVAVTLDAISEDSVSYLYTNSDSILSLPSYRKAFFFHDRKQILNELSQKKSSGMVNQPFTDFFMASLVDSREPIDIKNKNLYNGNILKDPFFENSEAWFFSRNREALPPAYLSPGLVKNRSARLIADEANQIQQTIEIDNDYHGTIVELDFQSLSLGVESNITYGIRFLVEEDWVNGPILSGTLASGKWYTCGCSATVPKNATRAEVFVGVGSGDIVIDAVRLLPSESDTD